MSNIKVLFVDDEPSILEVIGERIISWGYDVIPAENGVEAIRLLKSERPDIIVLDYMMPEMDGIETLKEIRKVDFGIPVIMFTAYPDKKSMEASDRLGVAAYVPKVSADTEGQSALRTAIDIVLKKRRSE